MSNEVRLEGGHENCCRFATLTEYTKEPIHALPNYGSQEKFGTELRNVLQEILRGRGGSSCRFDCLLFFFVGNATQVRIRSEGPSTGTIARRAPTSLAYGQMFVFLRFQSMFFIQFNLHLIGRTVNNQAVIFKGNKTSLLDFVRFLRSIWGAGPTRRGMFHDTEVNHANLCLVVDCFTGEIHQSREAGPPKRPQREPRRPL